MKSELLRYRVQNFKSLGDVCFKPSRLNLLIGPNNSGKSNFSESFRFLSEVYSYGLETAVRRNGGYENIALRRLRRSKSAILFDVLIKVDYKKLKMGVDVENPMFMLGYNMGDHKSKSNIVLIEHRFSFKATGQKIKAEFKIESEYLRMYRFVDEDESDIFSYSRVKDKIVESIIGDEASKSPIFDQLNSDEGFFTQLNMSSQELVSRQGIFTFLTPLDDLVKNWIVYQLNPVESRKEGVPTPNPVLDIYGKNLPALVDWLMNHHNSKWEQVLDSMRQIIPGLINISTGYLHNKTLGLFFEEEGFGRAWNSEEVSDGTLLTLTMLSAIVDPRKTLVVLEEPENSVHPWILRAIYNFLQNLSQEKNVLITTHSHIIIDSVHPDKIWTISRKEGVSKLNRLVDLDEDIASSWKEGKVKLSEYVDSGIVESIVP